jgi:hypothetical protein
MNPQRAYVEAPFVQAAFRKAFAKVLTTFAQTDASDWALRKQRELSYRDKCMRCVRVGPGGGGATDGSAGRRA